METRGQRGDSRASWDDYYQFTGGLENQLTKTSQGKRRRERSQQQRPTLQSTGSTLCVRGCRNALSKDKVERRNLQFSSFAQP